MKGSGQKETNINKQTEIHSLFDGIGEKHTTFYLKVYIIATLEIHINN
jgi:hypothetical protein